jgi:predicted O-methyltransferase YrrM
MRIIDCFPYFNERELLELRINLLYDHVDKFIICDADRTHSGKPKPFTCKETINFLGLPKEKIQIVEVELPQKSIDSWESPNWFRERMQRNAASSFIEDGDVCFVSDCDEIIDPKYLKYYASIASQNPNNILRVPLVFLTGRADLRVYDQNSNPREWNAAYFCTKTHLKKYSLSDIREASCLGKSIEFSDIFVTENGKIQESGWHFSWMGDPERIKTKCSSFLHHDEVTVVENYYPKINSTDPIGRTDHILKRYNIKSLPSKIFELERVKNFLIPEKTWRDIDGFFEYPSFYDMCMNVISDNSIMVEVGSWMGRSSTYVASLIRESGKNIKFYCVDTWEGSEEHVDLIKSLGEQGATLYEVFQNNISECGVKDYITPIKLESIEAAKVFADESIDFIHIDAAHDYDNVLADIKAWYSKIKPGGLITGDDYGWDGVYRAVNDYFGVENITYYDHDNKNGNLWFYKKPEKVSTKLELKEVSLESLMESNLSKKYNIKMKYDQHRHNVDEYYYDIEEELSIKLFENYVLSLQEKNKSKYNMIELGSNYSYYSMLFKKILGSDKTFNVMVEPFIEYMQTGIEHFRINNLDGVFLNETISNPERRWNNVDFKCPSTTVDELIKRYNIEELDLLHCDIDETEIHALKGAKESLQNKKIDLIIIMTHTLPDTLYQEYYDSFKGIPTHLHKQCKEFLLDCGYHLLYDHPQCSLGNDAMLIFRK